MAMNSKNKIAIHSGRWLVGHVTYHSGGVGVCVHQPSYLRQSERLPLSNAAKIKLVPALQKGRRQAALSGTRRRQPQGVTDLRCLLTPPPRVYIKGWILSKAGGPVGVATTFHEGSGESPPPPYRLYRRRVPGLPFSAFFSKQVWRVSHNSCLL